MAAGGALCRYSPAESSQESGEPAGGGGGGAGALHDRLVAYVHSLEHGWRSGVWGEHSYARERGARAAAGAAGRARLLLAPRAPSPLGADEQLDVVGSPLSPPLLPAPSPRPAPDEEEPADAEEWEARLAALAPSAAHARLAAGVADALRRMRLERLAGAGGEARAAARRLRRALAPHWLAGGGRAAPAWLQAALGACLPRGPRRLYEEALGELRRAVPRLAERLTGAWAPPPPEPSWRGALGAPVSSGAEPWLVWVSSGCAALDARWERRLAAQLHTRVLRAGRGAGAAAPGAWGAAAAGAVRDQLTDALAEAGDRGVILGGVGAGAALCALLARGAGGAERAAGGVRGAVLLAPPLPPPEGAALDAVRLPLLLVAGTRAADAPRHAAHLVAEAGGAEGRGARRVLEVCGADSALRLPLRTRRRLRLPQHALDAALVEECVRWAVQTAEGEETCPSPPRAPPAPAPAPRRPALPCIVRQIDLSAEPPQEEYAHLPAAANPGPPAPAASGGPTTPTNSRSIEIVERGSPAPAPHDIMQMPIVFADDAACTDSSSTGSPVTVTSGKARGSGGSAPVKMTRVILAKRGAPGGAAGGPAAGRGGPRRLLVRRGGGVRLVARQHKQ